MRGKARYRTFKTTMGRKIRVRMSLEEVRERRILAAMICVSPFVMCWLFAAFAGMV